MRLTRWVPSMRGDSGMALVTTLTMLVVVLLLAITGARVALDGKRNARHMRDMDIAFQAAEAALRDAELDIEASPDARSRSSLFSTRSSEGFIEGCNTGAAGAQPYLGLCLPNAADGDIWNVVDWDATTTPRTVAFGTFTGRRFQTGTGAMPSRPPRYLIELVVDQSIGAQADGLRYLYRITALGFGPHPDTRAMVQSVYRKSNR
ncbi:MULTISPECIES: pilus assembly PilX family protein [Cupriavidus]|nr:PilX N-terminal domain-containing pilus assembly protein [Cupriavidus pauculus]